jgi:hypothetical protein
VTSPSNRLQGGLHPSELPSLLCVLLLRTLWGGMMSEKPDVGLGARLLVIETSIRALIDQASAADPELRGRIKGSVEVYLGTLRMSGEIEREFTERARASLASIVQPD